jgi:outer membrane protein assembly factor BamB
MRVLAIGFALIIGTGCATTAPHGPNRFVIEKLWVRNTLVKEHVGSQRQHRFAPLLTEDLIIQANAIDGVVAYDRELVQPKWRIPIKEGVEGGAIVVGSDLLFGASDGFFYAVDIRSGAIRWTYPMRSEGLSVPFSDGGTVYFVSGSNVLTALDIQSGKMLWVYTRRDPSMISIRGGSRPNVQGDTVYVGFSDGYLVALKKQSGALVWEVPLNRNKRFRDVDAHPVILEDRIYITSYDGALYCLNKADGRVLWNYEDGGESAVVPAGDRLYYSTSSGKTVAIDRASGKAIWSYDNATGIGTEPVIYRDFLLVGEMNGPINFLDLRTGTLIGKFEPGWGVTSRPVVDDQRSDVYFMSAGANLYALRMSWKRYARIWPWEQ